MTHYEQRLEQDLQSIHRKVEALGSGAEEALRRAVRALLDDDHDLAYETILRDQILNRQVRDLDTACHAFVARHLPSAGHLRFISSVLRLTIALERIGDYAVTICRESVQLASPPPSTVHRDLDLLSGEAQRALNQSMEAFRALNPDQARGTHAMLDLASAAYDKSFADLLEEGQHQQVGVRDLFAWLVIFNRLGRVCDQAKNICEEAIFAATGEVKAPRHFHILFLERGETGTASMAAAIARKAYPKDATFSAGCLHRTGKMDPGVADFMDSRGHGVSDIPVMTLDAAPAPANCDVIVGLGGIAREEVPGISYHTVFLAWPEISLAAGSGAGSVEAAYRALAGRLRDLMDVVRGSA